MENSWKTKAIFLYRWIRLSQNGVTIEQLLLERGYRKIAIYGFNELSKCMLYELKDSKVEIDCIIDKNGKKTPVQFKCVLPDEVSNLSIDAIVITYSNPLEVMEKLKTDANCDVISFEELIYEL